jgi:hypothetical protein
MLETTAKRRQYIVVEQVALHSTELHKGTPLLCFVFISGRTLLAQPSLVLYMYHVHFTHRPLSSVSFVLISLKTLPEPGLHSTQ